jgi:hypothetical protein
MNELDTFYVRLLQVGFMVLRQAFESGDQKWLKAELELFHNIPSLLGEGNVERHRYFWFSERDFYIGWLSTHGREEPLSRMRTFYEPIWNEMEPLLLRWVEQSDSMGKHSTSSV